jgi:hypothetical protein
MAEDINPKTGHAAGEAIAIPPINKAGAGSTVVAIGIVGGEVVLRFPKDVGWCALDPQTAVNVGESMARAAYEIRHGRPPPPNADALADEIKRKATDIIRQKMINRTALILRNLQDRRADLNRQAVEVVDRILQEVT